MLRFARKRFFSDWRNGLPAAIVVGFFVVAIAAPFISPPLDADEPALNKLGLSSQRPVPPNEEAILGTYPGNYDVFHSLIWGTRSALWFGLTVALFAAILGIIVGAASNLIGGPLGWLGMRLTDAFLALPVLAAIMLLNTVLVPSSGRFTYMPATPFQQFMSAHHLEPVILGMVLFSWMGFSRIIYTSIEQLKNQEFVLAARVTGVSNFRIFLRHVLPNTISPLVVLITRDVGGMVVLESAFAFIGVSHYTEWGQMIAVSRDWIIGPTAGFAYWWTFVPAMLMLILFSVSWQWLGQRINAVLNPRAFSYLQ